MVDVPASVPELLGSTQTLLDQVDPTLVNDLVNTISEALVGTEGAVERLTPAAQLVAATLIYSQPDLVTIIRNATTMLQRGEWMGPSLRPVSPQMEYVGRSLRSVITEVRPFADFTQGGKLIRERWKPTLERAATMVSTIAPLIGELAEVLVPAARRSGAPLANLDMASLLNQALLTMPGDSLRLTVTVPN